MVSLCNSSCGGGGGDEKDLGRERGFLADRGRMFRIDRGVCTRRTGGGFGDRARLLAGSLQAIQIERLTIDTAY